MKKWWRHTETFPIPLQLVQISIEYGWCMLVCNNMFARNNMFAVGESKQNLAYYYRTYLVILEEVVKDVPTTTAMVHCFLGTIV